MKVYPIFLNDLAGRRCIVFGGDHEAERKVQELRQCDADVVVIAPELTPHLRALSNSEKIQWHQRRYRPGDLHGAFLTIISETDPEATAPIYREAQEERVLINAMDDVPHCTFVAGSVVRRGPLVVSISTSGLAPALAVRTRERLEREFDESYERLLGLLAELRAPLANAYPSFEERRRHWYRVVDSDILDVLRGEGVAAARRRIRELTGITLNSEPVA